MTLYVHSQIFFSQLKMIKMKIEVLFSIVFLYLLSSGKAQEADGNIWDMLINDGNSNNNVEEPIFFEKAPTPTYSVYGPPAPVPIASSSAVGVSLGAGGSFSPTGILGAKIEVLKLIEAFVKFKGELVSRLYAIVVDNWDLIRTLVNTAIGSLGTLQAFTVNGIIILRKILEFASKLFGSWTITVPNVSVDFSTLLRESDLYNIQY